MRPVPARCGMVGERLGVEEQARHVLELVERLRLAW